MLGIEKVKTMTVIQIEKWKKEKARKREQASAREALTSMLEQDPAFLKACYSVLDWQRGATNFGAQLIALIRKADDENLARLGFVYPEHRIALLVWETLTEEEFEKTIRKHKEKVDGRKRKDD